MSDQLIIKRRRGNTVETTNQIITLNLSEANSTLLSLKKEIQKITRIKPLRQWLTSEDLKTVYDDNSKPLNQCGFKSGQVLVVKDLGPQMLWITVFYAEYVGPILMFVLLYYRCCTKEICSIQIYIQINNWRTIVLVFQVKQKSQLKFKLVYNKFHDRIERLFKIDQIIYQSYSLPIISINFFISKQPSSKFFSANTILRVEGKVHFYAKLRSALWMVAAHYIKRILETKFVHVFSRDSMPTQRALINCFHYWILCGASIGSELYLLRTFTEDPAWKKIFIALFAGFEFLNLMCHVRLASFRKQPAIKKNDSDYVAVNKQRQIPYGWGFGRISSANYFWETMAWVSFTIFTGSYAGIVSGIN